MSSQQHTCCEWEGRYLLKCIVGVNINFVQQDKILCWWIKWIAFSEWCCLKIVLCNEFWNMIVEIRFYQIKGKLNLYFSAWLIIYSLSVTVSSQTTAQLTQHSSLFIYTVDSQRASDKHTAVQCQMSNTTLLVNNMRHRVFNHCLVFWPDMTHIWCVSHCSCVQDVFNLKRQKKRVFAHFMSNRKTKVLNVCLLWLIKDTVKSVFWPVNATLYDGLCHTEAWVDCADPICCICNQSLCSPVQ